ncbi:D-arabinono-1,4-lactone oxidase-domain-containing protein [Dipodascopsis uninucleata]
MSDQVSIENVKVCAIPRRMHSTWALTFFCQPELYLQPSSVEQLQQIVKTAAWLRKTVTMTGSGHSPSDITMTNEWLINLDKFNKVLSFSKHESGLFTDVRVEAGIRVYELHRALSSRGLAMQNLGSISEQSVAGLISTGTHGSTAFHGLLSQQVVDITLMLSSGELITVSQKHKPDIFRAALLSLGKLGVITHMTIRAVPSFTIHSFQEIIDFDHLLKDWETIWISKEFVRVWWFPYSRKCIIWRAKKSHRPLSAPRESFYGTWLGRKLYEAMLWFSVTVYTRSMPYVERFVFNRQYGWEETYGTGGSEAVQDSVDGLNMDCLFRQFVNEWALPLADGVSILKDIDKIVTDAAATGSYYVHAPIEVRCSNNSTPEESLSPFDVIEKSSGIGAIPGNTLRPLLDYSPHVPHSGMNNITNENLTLYINATMYRPFGRDPPIGQWYSEFEDIMVKYNGKPHWAKNFIGKSQELPEKVEMKDGEMVGLMTVFDTWYGDDGALFKAIRKQLDPEGVFLGGKEWAKRNGII